MTRSSRMMAAAAMILAATLCSAQGYAQDAKPGHDREAMKEAFYKDLNATPEQREALKAHRQENKAAMQAVHEQMKAKRDELRAEIGKPTVDMAKVESIKSDLKALDARLVDQRVDSILSLKKILTPEQFQKMHDKMEQRKGMRGGERMGKGNGKHHGGPGGPGGPEEGPEGLEDRGE